VAENDEAMFSICHIWPRDVIDDVALMAVLRQSFVIHSNGGWWQSKVSRPPSRFTMRSGQTTLLDVQKACGPCRKTNFSKNVLMKIQIK
jgi:hypothetical protein